MGAHKVDWISYKKAVALWRAPSLSALKQRIARWNRDNPSRRIERKSGLVDRIGLVRVIQMKNGRK